MPDQIELDWLAQERPQPLPLDAAMTARVRSELLERRDRGADTGRRGRAGVRAWVWRGLAGGVTVGGTAAAVLAVISVGGQGAAGVLATRGPAIKAHHALDASDTRLKHLSFMLADQATPPGDATLVLRRQVYPNSPEIDGADLYGDNGDYYYSPTLSGLPAAIQQDQTVNTGSADSEQRDTAVAEAALTEPIAQGLAQMATAGVDPSAKHLNVVTPSGNSQLSAELRQKRAQMETQVKKENLRAVMSSHDGMIWDNGMDALLAGAGNPQVRAGVLKLYAAIPQISTSDGTLNGKPTLDVTASLLSSNSGLYQEQLVLDANTGVPLEMIGGNKGQAPTVTVYYTVSRTTIAAVQNGSAS
ncbi:MAG TPA: hypothetical protein VHU61_10750 [Solirubrobacteraceae bacterium]|jgi:hypothetical protein|nr:hypothetical protein [Solirubrobacteraceae bacterium]